MKYTRLGLNNQVYDIFSSIILWFYAFNFPFEATDRPFNPSTDRTTSPTTTLTSIKTPLRSKIADSVLTVTKSYDETPGGLGDPLVLPNENVNGGEKVQISLHLGLKLCC